MSGLWLTDMSKGREKSHNWSLKVEAGIFLTIYSACGLFSVIKDLSTTDLQRCKRCKFILKARRNKS